VAENPCKPRIFERRQNSLTLRIGLAITIAPAKRQAIARFRRERFGPVCVDSATIISLRRLLMIRSLASLAVLALALSPLPASAQKADPTGVWINQEGSTKVRVSKCGAGLCGSVAWLREPNDRAGQPKVDKENPDASKRNRRLIGLPVLLNMKPNGDGKWSGRIYNADDGNTYVSNVELASANAMKVQGCVLGGLICKNMNWTRSN
jgi:uncharacterized protein (DUF2147 family)